MECRRKGVSGQVAGSILVAGIIAAAFGVYYFTTTSSLSLLSSQLSSDRSSLSSAEGAISADQSSISSMAARISSLSSELSAAECSIAILGNASECVTSVTETTSQVANPSLVNVSGSLHVPTGSGQGTLDVIVYNGLNESIVAMSVDFGVLSAPNGPMIFNYSGSLVSSSNPLPFGKTAVGLSTVQSGTQGLYFGYGYSINVRLTLQDGEAIVKQLYVQATM